MLSYILITAAIAFISDVSNAFTALPRSGAIHRSFPSSSTSLSSGCFDDIFCESSQFYEEEEEKMILALYHNESVTVSDEHILNSIMKVTGMAPGEIYYTIFHSKGIAKVAELDMWPRRQAEQYYEKLVGLGIPVFLC